MSVLFVSSIKKRKVERDGACDDEKLAKPHRTTKCERAHLCVCVRVRARTSVYECVCVCMCA